MAISVVCYPLTTRSVAVEGTQVHIKREGRLSAPLYFYTAFLTLGGCANLSPRTLSSPSADGEGY